MTVEEMQSDYAQAKAEGDMVLANHIGKLILKERKKEQEALALEGMGTGDKLLAGVGHGMANVADKVTGLFGGSPMVDKEASAPLMSTKAGKVGDFAGEVAATLPISMGAGGLVRSAGSRMLPKALTTGLGWAAEGAAPGALMAEEGKRGQGAMVGGAAGVALPLALRGAGKFLRGMAKPEAGTAQAELLERGVDLTPGQARPTSFGQLEDLAASYPIVGKPTRAAQKGGMDSWRNAVIEEGIPPGGTSPAGEVTERLDNIRQQFNAAYDNIFQGKMMYPSAGPVGKWKPLPQAFNESVLNPKILAEDKQRQAAAMFLDNQLTMAPTVKAAFSSPGALRKVSAVEVQTIRSNIREAMREARQAGKTEIAAILDDAQQKLTQALEQQVPDAAQHLRALDTKYSAFARTANAAGNPAVAVKGGAFTPMQLERQALKGASPLQAGTGRGGNQPLRDLAETGYETFSQATPDTGQKAVTQGVMSGLGTVVGGAMGGPAGGAAGMVAGSVIPMAAGVIASTPALRHFAVGSTAWQKALDRALAQVPETVRPALTSAIVAELQRK